MNLNQPSVVETIISKILRIAEAEGHGIIVVIEGVATFQVDYEWFVRECEIVGIGGGDGI